jgi:hypothetical protein
VQIEAIIFFFFFSLLSQCLIYVFLMPNFLP